MATARTNDGIEVEWTSSSVPVEQLDAALNRDTYASRLSGRREGGGTTDGDSDVDTGPCQSQTLTRRGDTIFPVRLALLMLPCLLLRQ